MAHEDLTRYETVEGSSDRVFGLVIAGVFFLIGSWPMFYGARPRWWAYGGAVFFLLLALWKPALLAELNRQWIKFGLLLGKLVSPIALAIVYYGVLTPIAMTVRFAGKDPLRLKREVNAASYWIPREPPGPPPDSMTNQF